MTEDQPPPSAIEALSVLTAGVCKAGRNLSASPAVREILFMALADTVFALIDRATPDDSQAEESPCLKKLLAESNEELDKISKELDGAQRDLRLQTTLRKQLEDAFDELRANAQQDKEKADALAKERDDLLAKSQANGGFCSSRFAAADSERVEHMRQLIRDYSSLQTREERKAVLAREGISKQGLYYWVRKLGMALPGDSEAFDDDARRKVVAEFYAIPDGEERAKFLQDRNMTYVSIASWTRKLGLEHLRPDGGNGIATKTPGAAREMTRDRSTRHDKAAPAPEIERAPEPEPEPARAIRLQAKRDANKAKPEEPMVTSTVAAEPPDMPQLPDGQVPAARDPLIVKLVEMLGVEFDAEVVDFVGGGSELKVTKKTQWGVRVARLRSSSAGYQLVLKSPSQPTSTLVLSKPTALSVHEKIQAFMRS